MEASLLGNFEIAKTLIEHGADINLKNNKGSTALIMAVEKEQYEIAKLLVEHKADLNVLVLDEATGQKKSALIIAAEKGNVDIAKLLIEHGATNVGDGNYTALMAATKFGHDEIIKLLNSVAQEARVNSSKALLRQHPGVKILKQMEYSDINLFAYKEPLDFAPISISAFQKMADGYIEIGSITTAMDFLNELYFKDINKNGVQDVIVKGSSGAHLVRLLIFKYDNGRFMEVLNKSGSGGISFSDEDGDGIEEIVVGVRNYDDAQTSNITTLKWNGSAYEEVASKTIYTFNNGDNVEKKVQVLTASDAIEIICKLGVINKNYEQLNLLDKNYLAPASDLIPNMDNYYIFEKYNTRDDYGCDYLFCVNKYTGKVYNWWPDGSNKLLN